MNMNIDRECLSKVRYDSEEAAEREARISLSEGHGGTYACIFCRGAHLSSQSVERCP